MIDAFAVTAPRKLSFQPKQSAKQHVIEVPVHDERDALIAQLKAQLAKAEAKPAPKLSLKVSAKGAVSLYGMGRWPVTLYRSQWETLLSKAEDIKAFIEDNASALSVKGE